MDLAGVIIVAIRWTHLLAAVALIGSAFYCLAFLAPGVGASLPPAVDKLATQGLREMADVTLAVFLASGVILTYDRLAGGGASPLYVGLLALKVALAGVLFHLVFRLRQKGLADGRASLQRLVAVGAVILLLAVALRTIYQAAAGLAG